MADIRVTGFIDKELTNARGEQFGFELTETHRKKQDDGTYKTIARTFHKVKGNATIGHRKGDRVTVTGRQVTEPWDRDGETRYSLMVWADKVDTARTGNTPAPPAKEPTDPGTPPEDPWADTHQWETTPIPGDETPW